MKGRLRSAILPIAHEELRASWRARVTLLIGALTLLLAVTATLIGLEHRNAINAERARYQHTADEQWHGQPDRHPHRVVHYGHYVFRPLGALAFFDFGIDPFTGHTLYLEGHRQNTANFSDAGQSSILLRFGLLTPAFVLQTLVPLLIIFVAFGSVARERERGQLRMVMVQGVSGSSLLAGKVLGCAVLALLVSSPAFAALLAIAVFAEASAVQALLMMLGYAAYLLLWVLGAVLVSAALPRAREALLALVGIWIALVILLPRVLPDLAAARIELPTRIETDIAVHKDLKAIGDAHNPNDPYFADFRARTLARYGVSRVEDLPVNYGGLLLAEGERLTSELFDRHMQESFLLQDRQSEFVNAFAWVSPLLALRQMSMALSSTDRQSHERFLAEAEKYRFSLIQALNRLHTEEVRYQNDRDQRIDNRHWQTLPRFSYRPAPLEQIVKSRVLPALAVLATWLVGLVAALRLLAIKLERAAR
ncbi:MAG TPA: DUF3526 domain-containing protein [Noviherbaspirillum sp.]